MKKIYIIGDISETLSKKCENDFFQAQLQLIKMGFEVINPIDRFLDKSLSFEEAKRKNFRDLITSSAVYVLSSTKLSSKDPNIELKLAFDFNLTIISGILDIENDEKPNGIVIKNEQKSDVKKETIKM